MTDGGEGHRDDGVDGRERPDQRAPDGEDAPPAPAAETPASEADQTPSVDGERSVRSGSTPNRSEPEESAGEPDDSAAAGPRSDPPILGEPTAANVARIRARESELERGEITAYTTERRMLDPLVRLQWVVSTGIVAVILGLVASAILAALGFPPEFGSVIVGLLLVAGVGWVVLRYRVWIYQVREDSLYLERGIVTHVRTIVPYVRIQHVDTSRGPIERALGLSTLVVYTAGSRGADVSVPGLKPGEASDLQQRLKELAIEAEGDDAL